MSITAPTQKRRAFWLKHFHAWHWVSAALCLVGMIFFSVTGITLNHAGDIGARPQVTTLTATLPDALLQQVAAEAEAAGDTDAPLPADLGAWLSTELGIPAAAGQVGEWSSGEIYVGLPRPGGDAWLTVDLDTGKVLYEVTDRGWVSYFNDLHKGRNTGPQWVWFIDIFAAACLVFSITGLVLLQLHGGNRVATWPTVALGLVAPLLLILLFIH